MGDSPEPVGNLIEFTSLAGSRDGRKTGSGDALARLPCDLTWPRKQADISMLATAWQHRSPVINLLQSLDTDGRSGHADRQARNLCWPRIRGPEPNEPGLTSSFSRLPECQHG